MFNLWNGSILVLFLGIGDCIPIPFLVQFLCKSSNILDINKMSDVGPGPTLIEKSFT